MKKPVFVNIAKASDKPVGKLISKYIKVVVTYLNISKQLPILIADMVATIKSVDKYQENPKEKRNIVIEDGNKHEVRIQTS